MSQTSLPDQLKAYVARAQVSLQKVPAQLPHGRLELPELFNLNAAYLGVFGLLAFLLPSLATLVYGGDSEPYYANDWARTAAVPQIALAVLAVLTSLRDAAPSLDVILTFTTFYALSALNNFAIVFYGSLSIISFLNFAICGLLAYLHLIYTGLLGKKA